MRVAIFGTGYVGLVTGTCLAEVGHDVVCVDIDPAKVDGLNQGVVPIYEPGLSPMVKANHEAGRLRFTTDAVDAIAHGEVVFIAVGTPPDEDGSADLQYVLAVARTIGRNLQRPCTVVNKSTVPVGTADKVRASIEAELASRGVDVAFDVVSNPEFLKEGDAVNDCMRPDRIVLGSRSAPAVETMKRLYAPFNRNHERIVVMDERSAELTKYAANAMLATKISFMNEMANIAERVGADIEQVRQGIGSDPRIGYHFIYPGAGYGGSCFPKDVQALERTARQPRLTAAGLAFLPRARNLLGELEKACRLATEIGQGLRVASDPLVGEVLAGLTGIDVGGVARTFAGTVENVIWDQIGFEEETIRRDPRGTRDPLIIGVFGGGNLL